MTPEPLRESAEIIEPTWTLNLTIRPTQDGRFAQIHINQLKASSRVPINIHITCSTDMLYERVQGELNNALRQTINDIQLALAKLKNKHNRR